MLRSMTYFSLIQMTGSARVEIEASQKGKTEVTWWREAVVERFTPPAGGYFFYVREVFLLAAIFFRIVKNVLRQHTCSAMRGGLR